MDRYDGLDLECEGGGVAQKAALFGGMFKRSSKLAEPSDQAQDNLLANGELSKSNDNLADSNSNKDKGGVFKGMFKKTTKSAKDDQPQGTLSLQNPELSASSDSLTDNSKSTKDKSGVFGGILKRAPKPGHVRRPSQDLLDNKLSASDDSLSENNKESGGMFSGIFKKSPKPFGARAQSQDDLSAPSELSGSNDNLSVNGNTKESGGMFSGIFKKSPKPFGARAQSQDDLSAPSELSGSNDNLSENNTKEKGGLLSGVFKKKGPKSQSQDDLSVDGELSASSDSLIEKSSKGGVAAKLLKNPFTSSSQEKDRTEHSGDSNENTSSTEKPKVKQNGLSAMMKNTFYTDRQEKNADTDGEETLDNGEGQPSHKQNKLAGAMTKLNPFRSANKNEKQTGSDDEEPPAGSDKSSGNKQVKSNMIQQERKERSEAPLVPPRPTEEEMKRTSTYDKVKPKVTEDNQDKKDMISRQKKEKPAETPVVPARPSEEEMNRAPTRSLQKQKNNHQNQSDDETLKQDAEAKQGDEVNPPDSKTTKVKKHKHHNPFMPRAAAKAASDDEELKEEDESLSKEEKKDEEGKDKKEETKVKKPKRHNPFMPRVKAKVVQRHTQDGAADSTAENEGGNRSLFDQLEDFRIDPAQPEDDQDVDLMEWWNTVEPWEDTPQDDDMTEKEEAKAFALTAEKVQKGIRVFNKLFSERAESLWQHVIDLNSIADSLDKFNKNTKIAQITGGSTSAIGGVATIAGLALAPVTFGTSLIVTAVGLGVATAGGLTSAGAGISNQVNNSMDRKKVEKIVEDYQEKIVDLNKCLKFIKQGIENLRKFDLLKMKKHAYNRDFPALTSSFYEDGAMAGKAILINANEIMRVVQIANVAGSTAARAVQIASMATGVLTGLFVGMDIYFVAKDSKELKKGAKSEFAAKIRDVATQLHDGLVELNGIREELQSTTPENNMDKDTADLDNDKKEKDDKYESSDEDEIDRIKKAIKKDYENREYV
ncbi:protein starmaker-like isoform X4 [Trachinotus anak]|uniref:protein starmaker-like isoform X4 n=1 Tax=Trachinotus anak TaxID=443729 RepID=UPI0039F1E1C0